MDQRIEPAQRVVLEPPSRGRTFREVTLNRIRLVLDRVLHRPPGSRTVERNVRVAARQILELPVGEFDALWEEARRSRLEERIAAQLRLRFPNGPPILLIASPEGDWLEILRFLYVLVRATRPAHAVETGVGPVGASTTFILGAMHENRAGHLWSLDVGHYLSIHGVEPGNGIPDELRDRHTLLIAGARTQLARVMDQCVPPAGLFLHDSEHTYANMTFEYGVAWSRLALSGYLLSDDSRNDAVDRFGARVGLRPRFIEYGGTPFGVLRKP
jgi:hypothetical protein